MKKIPTLFKREFANHEVVKISPEVTEGLEFVLDGKCTPTMKWDGSCCALHNGKIYKRYDAKKGKKPPEGAIPCCDPDPVTGHWPHWVEVNCYDPSDKWFVEAFKNTFGDMQFREYDYWYTYEAIGKHFNGNPYGIDYDFLMPHGREYIDIEPDFESIKKFFETHIVEGLVFWKDGEPICKIKRSDFGLPWGNKK